MSLVTGWGRFRIKAGGRLLFATKESGNVAEIESSRCAPVFLIGKLPTQTFERLLFADDLLITTKALFR
jgi:hypothetical protein